MISLQDRMQNVNKMFLITSPTIKMLTNPQKATAIIEFISIVGVCSIELVVFLLIGKTTYIKDILRNIVSKGKIAKANKRINISKKAKQKSITKAYVLKEIKLLLRNPSFFMQCIYPVIMLLISCIILVFRIPSDN